MLLAAVLAGLVVSRLGSAIAAKATPARAMLFGMLLYLSHLPLIYHHFNGLETGLVLLFYLAILYYLLRMNHKKMLSWLVLGLLCGLLVLARIDSAVFVALFSFKILLSRPSLPFWQRVRQFLLVAVTAAVVSGPWWMYNYFCFGSLMPSSGTAQQDLAITAARLRPMAAHIANLGMPWLWFHFPGQTIIKLLLLGGMIAGSTIILVRRAMDRHRATTNEVMYRLAEFAVPFIIYLAFLALYYSFTFWVTYFYGRYLAPVAVISVICLALLLLVGSDRMFWIKPALITAVTLPAFAVIGSWHRLNYLDAQLISQDQSSKYYVNQY